ncbi:MAG: MFS transporter [Gammaproteobacteria bacterium RIFCSPHIGHO2_12_FULL_41_15]|nr:MAG: MFS transporter [Gammaproteobacteria bacterium RIFCSPHIGHO2_12_FULL_41_15]
MKTLLTYWQNTQKSKTLIFHKAILKRSYAWLVILLSSFFLFYKYVLQMSPSVMTNELMRFFHLNAIGLGSLVATYFYAYLVTQLFVGPLLDRFSPRKLSAMAIAICAFGAYCFSQANSLWLAEIGRAFIGVGGAFATVSYMKMAALWFEPKQFAFVSGLLATASMVGSIAGQAPLALLMLHVGWQSCLQYCALLGVLLALLYFVVVRDKQPSESAQNESLTPTFHLKYCLTVLKSKVNWYLMAYSGFAFAPLAVFGGLWGNPFLEVAHHLSKEGAATLTSMMFLGLAVGGPVLGFLADRVVKRSLVMASGLVLSLISLCLSIYLSQLPTELVAVLLFLFGFGTGAFMLGFAMGRELNTTALAATVVALINTGDALCGAFSEPLVGKFLDLLWGGQVVKHVHQFSVSNYQYSLSLLPCYLVLAGLMLLLLQRSNKKY